MGVSILRIKDPAQFNCMDCAVNTAKIEERYSLKNEVWQQANPRIKGMLCVGCVEKRLGRELTCADFTDVPLNGWKCQSERLRKRVEGLKFKKHLNFYLRYYHTLRSDFMLKFEGQR